MSTSLIKISRTLNEIPDLETCCTSSNINKWTFYKPINVDNVNEIDAADYYENNDGFRLFTFTKVTQMLYSLQNYETTKLWEYIDREAPFRLTDFEHYIHNDDPYDLQFVNGNEGTPGTTMRLYMNADLQVMTSNWAIFEGARNSVDICILMYPADRIFSQDDNRGIYVYKLSNISDYDQEHINFTIPSNMTAGNYEVRICLSTATQQLNPHHDYYWTSDYDIQYFGTWYSLPPHCSNIMTVSSSGGGGGTTPSENYFNYVDFKFNNLVYTWNDPVLSDIEFDNTITLQNTTGMLSVKIDYYLSPSYFDITHAPVLLSSQSRTLSANDLTTSTIEVRYRDSQTLVGGGHLDDGILSVRVVVRITKNNTSQNKEWIQQIEI